MHRLSMGRSAACLFPITARHSISAQRRVFNSGSHQGLRRNLKNKFCLYASQSLAELELCTILNPEYIGFSKDLDASLKLVFTRRPDKSYFYKSCDLDKLDQEEMIKIRDAWFEEIGGPPIGNNLALERSLWQEPIESFAINARAKVMAAEEKAKAVLVEIKSRGCNEDFIPDPVKLMDGKIDFLPTKKLSPEDIAARQAERDVIAKASRVATIIVNGNEEEMSVFFEGSYSTNGGRMFDIVVGHDGRDTTHRVVIGRQYYEPNNAEPEEVVMLAMGYLISAGEPRHTEGLLQTSQFPVNYFSMSELDQNFPRFAQKYADKFGELKADGFWRFNRIESYGEMYEDAGSLAAALSAYSLSEDQAGGFADSSELGDVTVDN